MGKVYRETHRLLLNWWSWQKHTSFSHRVSVKKQSDLSTVTLQTRDPPQPFQVLWPISLALNLGIALWCEHPAAAEQELLSLSPSRVILKRANRSPWADAARKTWNSSPFLSFTSFAPIPRPQSLQSRSNPCNGSSDTFWYAFHHRK